MKKRNLLTMLLLIPTKEDENSLFFLGASVVITLVLMIGAVFESTFFRPWSIGNYSDTVPSGFFWRQSVTKDSSYGIHNKNRFLGQHHLL